MLPEDDDQPLGRRNSEATLARLLDAMIEHPERQAELAAELEDIFGETRAPLVLDMCGFSRTTRRHGIATFLLMIRRMRRVVAPAVEAAGGIVVKGEADNLYCLFDDAPAAVIAARDIMDRLDAANAQLPEAQRLYAAIGIGYGAILNIAGEDLFGDEVNLASKLGEDIAERGEILLTKAAHERLEEGLHATRPESVAVAGLQLDYHALTASHDLAPGGPPL